MYLYAGGQNRATHRKMKVGRGGIGPLAPRTTLFVVATDATPGLGGIDSPRAIVVTELRYKHTCVYVRMPLKLGNPYSRAAIQSANAGLTLRRRPGAARSQRRRARDGSVSTSEAIRIPRRASIAR